MRDTIRIPLGASGKPVSWAVIDLCDYERIVAYRWYLSGRGYAFRPNEAGRSVFMHREVLAFPDSEDINHINGDQLDNRRGNLEPCTHRHNSRVGALATVYPIRDRIRSLRLDGWTNRAIATELGINPASVSRYARDLPVVPHPSRKWTREHLIELVQEFHREHGRVPGNKDFDGRDGRPWFACIYRVFPGGQRELHQAAGFVPVDYRRAAA